MPSYHASTTWHIILFACSHTHTHTHTKGEEPPSYSPPTLSLAGWSEGRAERGNSDRLLGGGMKRRGREKSPSSSSSIHRKTAAFIVAFFLLLFRLCPGGRRGGGGSEKKDERPEFNFCWRRRRRRTRSEVASRKREEDKMHPSLLSQSVETHTRERHRTCTLWNLFAWLYRLALKKQGGGFTRVLLRGKSSNWEILGQSWKIRDFFLGNFRGEIALQMFFPGEK